MTDSKVAIDSTKLNQVQMMQRWSELDTEFSSWKSHAQEISNYILPRSGRYFTSDRNRGTKRHNNILDSTGTRALRVLGAGLMGGATSPARPWFRLAVADDELMKLASVKIWLGQVTRDMLSIFQRSNVYRSLHTMYEELGAFGTAVSIILSDYEDVIRLYPITYGEFRIATNDRGIVDTLYRQFDMTVSQLVKQFGIENCSAATQNMHKNGQLGAWVTVMHAIEPNMDRDPYKFDAKNMAWVSNYMEVGGDKTKWLSQSGFKTFRVLAPRWAVANGDIMGNCPGMEALGDIKQLQHEQLRKAEAIDYQTKPPLQIPNSMKNREIDRLPGGTSYIDMNGPNAKITSMFDVNLNLQHLLMDIQDVRNRINGTFYTDLFLMLANDDRSGITATEVAERHEEKLLMLGPVLERLHNELLDPLISITFQEMLDNGLLPPPPQELEHTNLSIEFVSMLAQAQRAISTNSVDRYVVQMGTLAQLGKPEVLDRFNADEWADRYADMLGVDPELIVPVEDANAGRQARAKQQQQMQAAAMAESASKTAKNLGTTPMQNGGSALDAATSQFSGYSTPQAGVQ